LEKGANVKVADEFGATVLMYAKSLPMIKMLSEYGADMNAANKNLMTPLMYAQRPEIVSFLLEHGAKIEARNDYGNSVLEDAITDDNLIKVKILVAKGANLGFKSEIYADNALHLATRYASYDVVRWLVDEKKFSVNESNLQGQPALLTALWGIVEASSAEWSPAEFWDKQTTDSYNVFMDKAFKTVVFLAKRGANLDAKDRDGYDVKKLIDSIADMEMAKKLLVYLGNTK